MATTETLIAKINNGDNKAFHELYGNDAAELKRNAKRYSGLLKQFNKEFGKKDVEFLSRSIDNIHPQKPFFNKIMSCVAVAAFKNHFLFPECLFVK